MFGATSVIDVFKLLGAEFKLGCLDHGLHELIHVHFSFRQPSCRSNLPQLLLTIVRDYYPKAPTTSEFITMHTFQLRRLDALNDRRFVLPFLRIIFMAIDEATKAIKEISSVPIILRLLLIAFLTAPCGLLHKKDKTRVSIMCKPIMSIYETSLPFRSTSCRLLSPPSSPSVQASPDEAMLVSAF